jgi:hypothetical protein
VVLPFLFRRPGEVLIKVAAASINPIDFKMRGAHGGVPKFAITLPKVKAAHRMDSTSMPAVDVHRTSNSPMLLNLTCRLRLQPSLASQFCPFALVR